MQQEAEVEVEEEEEEEEQQGKLYRMKSEQLSSTMS